MKTRKPVFGFIALIIFCILNAGVALADKSAVTIEGPDEVAKGTEATVKLNVTHSGNNFFHYTKWVKVKANGTEIAHWDYSMTHRPEGANFTKEIKVTVAEDLEIIAEASCNLHGSAGPAVKKIAVR